MPDKLLTIPQIRHCLHVLAGKLEGDPALFAIPPQELAKILRHLAEQTRRRPTTRRPSTEEAQAFMAAHPDADQLEAANAFGNSEALNGFRGEVE